MGVVCLFLNIFTRTDDKYDESCQAQMSGVRRGDSVPISHQQEQQRKVKENLSLCASVIGFL